MTLGRGRLARAAAFGLLATVGAVGVVGAVGAVGVTIAPPAGAEAVTAEQLGELIGRAAADPAALDRLRGVDAVDGRPVDVESALGGATGQDLAARLDRLAAGARAVETGATQQASADPAAAAAAILAADRFQPPKPEEPGILRRLGQLTRPVFRSIGRVLGRVFRPVARFVARGFQNATGTVFWGFVILAFVALATVVAVRRRAARALAARSEGGLFDERDDPRQLERQADEAAAAGDHRLAVRLRFRAGLVRLHSGGAPIRPSMTTGQLAVVVGDATFDALGRTFDAIVYGGRLAGAHDVQAARDGWTSLLASTAVKKRAA